MSSSVCWNDGWCCSTTSAGSIGGRVVGILALPLFLASNFHAKRPSQKHLTHAFLSVIYPDMTAFNVSWISKRMSLATLRYPAVAVGVAVAFAILSACGPSGTPNQSTPSSGVDLAYGTEVSFGAGGNSEPFRVSGWSGTEKEFTWTVGTSAVLAMRVSPTPDPVALKMKLAGLIKDPELPFQPVEVYINDQKVADWQVAAAPAEFSAAIPQEMARSGGLLRITLKIPKAASPKALGYSNQDPRVLGVQCYDLQLAKTS